MGGRSHEDEWIGAGAPSGAPSGERGPAGSAVLLAALAAAEDASTLEAVSQRVVEVVDAHTDGDGVALHAPEPGSDRLRLLASRGLPALADEAARDASGGHNDAPEDAPHAAARSLRTVVIADPRDPAAAPYRALSRGDQAVAVASTPLLSAGRLVGVITVARAAGRPFSTKDVALLELIARAAAPPLARQRLLIELRALTRTQADALRRERAALHDLEEFTSTAVHDLTEPLRSLATLATYLEQETEEGGASDDARDMARQVRSLAERVRGMVRRMGDFARLGSAAEPATDVSARQLLEIAAADAAASLGAPPECVVIEGDDARLRASRGSLEFALRELFRNALQHADAARPEVRAGTRDAGAATEFWIADNGPGVPLALREAVFGVFHKGAETRDAPEPGVGLALVRKVAERHGGRAWIEAAVPTGTVAWLRIPKAPTADDHPRRP